MQDAWDPRQYQLFAEQRNLPFFDLVDLVRGPVPRAVDLGCGTGHLTAELGPRLSANEVLGIDSSPAMLEQAVTLGRPGLQFVEGDLGDWREPASWDLVLSNAAIQWVGDHPALLRRFTESLLPGGQLAIQVPANFDHASHRLSREVAQEKEFRLALGGDAPPDPDEANVLPPERYATLLHDLGFAEQHVRVTVYGHLLPATASVVEWVRGTSLTRFQRRLPADLFERFVAEYRRRLLHELGDQRPYFYTFKRILIWGRLPA
jgi:trans-aconitate 2-methyltransferase